LGITHRSIVLLLVNHLDEDDFLPMIQHTPFKDNLFVILDAESIPPYKTFPTAFIQKSFKNPEEIISHIKEYAQQQNKDIAGIIGLDEEYRYAVSKKISEFFALPFYKQSTIDTIINKYTQAVCLAENNVLVPNVILFNQMSDAQTFPFPNVLKIVTGIGSKFVYLNKDHAELEAHVEDFKEKSNLPVHNNLILESFVGGDEYSCDFLIDKKSIQILRVVKKITSPTNFPFFGGFYLFNPFNAPSHNFSLATLEKTCRGIAQAFELDRGVCMMDFKFFEGKLFVIETTIRPGIAQFIDLMITLYQYTSIDILIKQILHLNTQVPIPDGNGLIFYISTQQTGMLKKFDCSLLEKDPRIHYLKKYYKEGQSISREANKSSRSIVIGHIMITDIQEAAISKTIAHLLEKISIEIAPL
jgi:hypothetical protein